MAQTGLGLAWIAATVALALHVADEAMHDFLGWYNPIARRVRQAFGGLPFPPTFSFPVWIGGLAGAVLALALLTSAAYGGGTRMRAAAVAFGVVHVANGLLHLCASLVSRRAVPGVITAPVLIVTGAWLLWAALGIVAHVPP